MNRLTLAVAGARKTQSIVDACAGGAPGKRRLVITYTLTGQAELQRRLTASCSADEEPEILGWYAFLMRHFIKPFLPALYPGRRLRGLNFEGEPARGKFASGAERHLDTDSNAYKLHLSRLALNVSDAVSGAPLDRLQRMYEEIYVDEVQDLTGCDLHILDALMGSSIDLHLVGDIRQSVFDTNPRDQNLTQFRGIKMGDWFAQQEKKRDLVIVHSVETWRCSQAVADLADTVFGSAFDFPATVSKQTEVSHHAGIFAITEDQIDDYMATHQPRPLRESIVTARDSPFPFTNFGKVKGITEDHVLIYPTGPIRKFLETGAELKPKTACGLYVAITRAKHSVAFVVPDPSKTSLTTWTGPTGAG